MAKLPTFAAGDYEKILPSIQSGVLTYPAYVYIRDKKGLAFIDQDGSINEIVGNNPVFVEAVDVLPDPADAKSDVLYICKGIVYVLNEEGTVLNPMYQDVTEQLEKLATDIETLDNRITELEGKPGLVFNTKAEFPETGVVNILYIATDEPALYMWDEEQTDYIPFLSDSSSTIQWIEL